MSRVERSTDQQGNAFSLFQTAINLEGQVRRRTEELTTTLQRLEQSNRELTQARDLAEQANLSKTRFLAAASHDVMQPLNAASLLMSSLTELQVSSKGRRLAHQVESSLETIDELLRSLLDISRLDAGVVKPKLDTVPVHELFESLRSDFEPIAKARNIDFRVRSSALQVVSDRSMLRRILQNLISNAIRYTPQGGVLVACRSRGQQVEFRVLDTGIGIPPAQYDHIFEEFHRGKPAERLDGDISTGLGLGLSIVNRMSKTLNHKLTFRSNEGTGSEFTLTVESSRQSLQPSIDHQRSVGASRLQGMYGTRVLLIENDVAVKNAMLDLFEQWHCEVKAAEDKATAIAHLADNRWQPNIVIADQHLDNNDLGTETIATIRNNWQPDLPAIIITADPSDELSAEAAKSAIELMFKPVKPAQLRALLAHVLTDQE